MKKILLIAIILTSVTCFAQKKDAQPSAIEEQKIRNLLKEHTEAWNNGDIEGFMQGYWKSDSLMFIGKSGVNWGWEKTLENYKKGYPDTTAMGKLSFDIISVKRLSFQYYSVVGKWMLKRCIGDLSGHFTLLLKKIKGQWVIIADHSS